MEAVTTLVSANCAANKAGEIVQSRALVGWTLTMWAGVTRLRAENRLRSGFLPPMGVNSLGQVRRDRLFFPKSPV